ncbi:cytochrome c nitrite reductase small subunit [Lujinxingia litoralis]|uniref:Cytochrome c nitrite reductase small subunit n=1 Tax=Lujinxingia litoralis TaxID=2211119 RepID=A0A328C459_9DELT|nr:cytochrome c nitrite reductase small subunit [Lujinxingia litoralis]RAL21509.1 cytochrome c nitrite reductase small subunit [Lujinxingia litoralis]
MNAIPTRAFGIALAIGVGVLVGVGLFTFLYADGHAYLQDDPQVCANCHIMQPHYDAWVASSHHQVATCNDCHTPEALIPKYVSKADNGFRHAWAFTLNNVAEPIAIIPRNQRVLQDQCLRCHGDLVHPILDEDSGPRCVNCHFSVGHADHPRPQRF